MSLPKRIGSHILSLRDLHSAVHSVMSCILPGFSFADGQVKSERGVPDDVMASQVIIKVLVRPMAEMRPKPL